MECMIIIITIIMSLLLWQIFCSLEDGNFLSRHFEKVYLIDFSKRKGLSFRFENEDEETRVFNENSLVLLVEVKNLIPIKIRLFTWKGYQSFIQDRYRSSLAR